MSCWSKEQLENMLEDVVNELDLSELAIEKHGPLGTAPAKLVRLVLDQKDREIDILRNGGRVLIKQPELICPNCGHYPLTLEGTATLGTPKDRKSYCDVCSYEEKF